MIVAPLAVEAAPSSLISVRLTILAVRLLQVAVGTGFSLQSSRFFEYFFESKSRSSIVTTLLATISQT